MARRILFPFTGQAVSQSVLDAVLRLARAEGATLVAAYVATVPLEQALEVSAPEVEHARPLLESIDHRARRLKVPTESRIEVGRSPRHALQELMERERFDRVVIPAATGSSEGFSAEDIGWLLDRGSEEIVVLRPELNPGPRSPVVPKPVADPGIGDDVPGV